MELDGVRVNCLTCAGRFSHGIILATSMLCVIFKFLPGAAVDLEKSVIVCIPF